MDNTQRFRVKHFNMLHLAKPDEQFKEKGYKKRRSEEKKIKRLLKAQQEEQKRQ